MLVVECVEQRVHFFLLLCITHCFENDVIDCSAALGDCLGVVECCCDGALFLVLGDDGEDCVEVSEVVVRGFELGFNAHLLIETLKHDLGGFDELEGTELGVKLHPVGWVPLSSRGNCQCCPDESTGVLANYHIEHVHNWSMSALFNLRSEDNIHNVIIPLSRVQRKYIEIVPIPLNIPRQR